MNPAPPLPTSKPSFHEQVFQVREAAIVTAVNRILSEKGFESMSVDEWIGRFFASVDFDCFDRWKSSDSLW